MTVLFTEMPAINRENVQHWIGARRDTARMADSLGGARDPSHDSVWDPQKLGEHVLSLECRSCGARWSTVPEPDGEFHKGFWRCPRRCDAW